MDSKPTSVPYLEDFEVAALLNFAEDFGPRDPASITDTPLDGKRLRRMSVVALMLRERLKEVGAWNESWDMP